MNPMEYELQVNQAAAGLSPQQFDEFRRLARGLAAYEKRWGLFLLKYEHTDDRRRVADAINKLIPRNATLMVSENAHPDWPSLEQAICQVAQTADAVQLFDLDAWLDTSVEPKRAEARLRSWNVRREGFAADVAVPVICWLRPATLKSLAVTAPDLWSWRAAVHHFGIPLTLVNTVDAKPIIPFTAEFDNRSLTQRTRRLSEIQQYLQQDSSKSEQQSQLRALLISEMAAIHFGMGELDEALRLYRDDVLPIYEKIGSNLSRATIRTKIAKILRIQCEYDEAYRMLQEEILPVVEKSGSLRDLAVVHSEMAALLQGRGELTAALQIQRKKVLPIFEQLSDSRACAMSLSKIAELLSALGEGDEALRIFRNEVLPRLVEVGDQREQAVTQDRIANILLLRGEFNESLHIYQELVQVAETLGDVHMRAVALGNIAVILQAHGEATEALRIYREEVLPVFERIGDKVAIGVTQRNIHAIIGKNAVITPENLSLNTKPTLANLKPD